VVAAVDRGDDLGRRSEGALEQLTRAHDARAHVRRLARPVLTADAREELVEVVDDSELGHGDSLIRSGGEAAVARARPAGPEVAVEQGLSRARRARDVEERVAADRALDRRELGYLVGASRA